MLLSIATAQWRQKDARQEIYGLVDEINSVGAGFDFNKDYILKSALVLSDVPNVRFRVNNFNKENMLKIESQWDSLSEALRLTAQTVSSWGFNWQNLSSNYATIPLAYYLFKIGNPSGFVFARRHKANRDVMQHWLRVALLKRSFGGTPDNILQQIRRAMNETTEMEMFPAEAIREALAPTNRSLSFDQAELEGLLSYRYGQSYTFIVLTMLYPWLKYDQQFHIDHIFPRAMFTKRGLRRHNISDERWPLWLDQFNNVGNLQLLQGPVNTSKSDKEFEAWLNDECSTPEALNEYRENHMIPTINLSFNNFPNFLEVRTNLMRIRLAELLGVQLNNNGLSADDA